MPNRERGRSRRVYGSALRLGLDAAGGKIVEGLGRLEKKKPSWIFPNARSGSDFVSPEWVLGLGCLICLFLRSGRPVECECELAAVT